MSKSTKSTIDDTVGGIKISDGTDGNPTGTITYTTDDTITLPDTHIYSVDGNWTTTSTTWPTYGTGDCCKCKSKNVEIGEFYNWGHNEKTVRRICKKCVCKAKDKEYGISEKRIKAEEALYGKG